MRKLLIGLALLAPTSVGAQVPYRGQRGFDTGPIVACTDLATGAAARCLMPGVVPSDATGTPIGSAANPLVTSSSGTKGDLDQSSTRMGVSYSVGTGIVSIPANNFLNVVFTCAAPTGSVCIVYLRGYGNGSTATLQYQNFRGPTAITGGTTKTVGNKSLAANAVASTSNLTYATSTATISTGTAAITDFVYPNFEVLLTPATVMKPGDTIGISISGIGGALAAAANAEVKIIEAEMPL